MTEKGLKMNLSISNLPRFCRYAINLVAISVILSTQLNAQTQTSQGKQLVDAHCTRCHLAPIPQDLSKDVWPVRLASMGLYLGMPIETLPDFVSSKVKDDELTAFFFDRIHRTATHKNGEDYDISSFKTWVLTEPILSDDEWVAIRDYFVDNAPLIEELVLPVPDNPELKGFKAVTPNLDIDPNGLIMATRVDEEKGIIYVGRAVGRMMAFLREGSEDVLALDLESGRQLARKALDTEPTFIELTETGIRLGVHGEFPIRPGEGEGYITDLVGFANGETTEHMLVNGMHRIIQLHTIDMNDDGLDDIVANTYGDGIGTYFGGGVSIYYQQPGYPDHWANAPAEIPRGILEGALIENKLLYLVGTISSVVDDFNNDGKPDIAVLIAQGVQQVIVLTNQGDGTFKQDIVAQHRPSFGGNSIDSADVDGDGNMDIIYMNGDNVYTNFVGGQVNTPKPLHGIHILKNNGNGSFAKGYSYNMHGTIRGIVEDFDGDGDPDIAALALYPDWRWEVPETFVYLENKGDFTFQPASLKRENFGIWLSIEAADVNGDDRPDIVLGLGDWPVFVPDDWKTRDVMQGRGDEVPSIMFLLNEFGDE
jgi:hypothetical protein